MKSPTIRLLAPALALILTATVGAVATAQEDAEAQDLDRCIHPAPVVRRVPVRGIDTLPRRRASSPTKAWTSPSTPAASM